MQKRLAVFRGDVSMGGKTYKAGEHWVRPKDVQALIDGGSVRWADNAIPDSWDDDGGAQPASKKKAARKKRKA